MKNLKSLLLISILLISSSLQAQNTSTIDRYFTTSDCVKIHYRVSGKGKPLVIFPGYGQDITKFNGFVVIRLFLP